MLLTCPSFLVLAPASCGAACWTITWWHALRSGRSMTVPTALLSAPLERAGYSPDPLPGGAPRLWQTHPTTGTGGLRRSATPSNRYSMEFISRACLVRDMLSSSRRIDLLSVYLPKREQVVVRETSYATWTTQRQAAYTVSSGLCAGRR